MAKRILVPLDQSPVAESVVPLVADLARGSGASVRLLHVASMPASVVGSAGRLVASVDQEMSRLEAEGLDYLASAELRLGDAPVERVVRFGDPVPEILREAEVFDADLIVVTTAGKSGLGRALLGSVAERVFHDSRVPVLLFHPGLSLAA